MLFRRVKAKLKGNFLRNVLMLMTGTSIAQVITFAIAPILTRLYTPEDFGLLALFVASASLVAVVATGRYELAIMLPDEEENAVNVVALSLLIAGGLSLLTLVVVALFKVPLANLLGEPEIAMWLLFIPLYVLFKGIYQTFNYWSNRRKQFKRLAVSRVSLSSAKGAANLGFGWGGVGTFGLIGGEVIGWGVAAGIFTWQVLRDDWRKIELISKNKIKQVAVEFQDFPKINSFHAFMDILQWSGISFLLAKFFGTAVLGGYSLTLRIIQAPLSLIGASVGQVFFQRASETYNAGGDLYGLVKRTMLKLSYISLPFLLLTMLFAPPFFAWAFGPEWREAGVYAQILAPWIFLKFIVSPVSQVPIILKKQKLAFYLSSILNVGQLVLLFAVATLVNDVYVNLMVLSGFASLFTIGYGWWILKLARGSKQ